MEEQTYMRLKINNNVVNMFIQILKYFNIQYEIIQEEEINKKRKNLELRKKNSWNAYQEDMKKTTTLSFEEIYKNYQKKDINKKRKKLESRKKNSWNAYQKHMKKTTTLTFEEIHENYAK